MDPHHRMALGAQVLRALRPRTAVGGRRSHGSGPSRASPPSCRPASPPTFPRHATRCGSTSRTFAASCAPPSTPTARCSYLLWTPRDRGVRLWAGSRVLAPAAIATLPKWMRRMGNFDQPAAVDAAVTPDRPGTGAGICRPVTSGPCWPWRAGSLPQTAEILARHLTAGPPAALQTVTPAEARERLAVHA